MKQFEKTITKNYRICITIWKIKWGKKSYELQTTQSHKINRNEQNFWKLWIKTDCCTADKHQINWNAKETRRFGWCFCAKCLSCREMVLFFLNIFVSDGCFTFENPFCARVWKKWLLLLNMRKDTIFHHMCNQGTVLEVNSLHYTVCFSFKFWCISLWLYIDQTFAACTANALHTTLLCPHQV